MEIRFILNGEPLHLSRETILRKLKKVEPETVRTHAVEIDGRLFPMKQAFAVATGVDLLDFTTNQARTQFKRLGFKVLRQ